MRSIYGRNSTKRCDGVMMWKIPSPPAVSCRSRIKANEGSPKIQPTKHKKTNPPRRMPSVAHVMNNTSSGKLRDLPLEYRRLPNSLNPNSQFGHLRNINNAPSIKHPFRRLEAACNANPVKLFAGLGITTSFASAVRT